VIDIQETISLIKKTESPLKKQLLIVALITHFFVEKDIKPPVIIGGCALSYYSREVYFTADIDLACADKNFMDKVLKNIGFEKEGKYWISETLNIAIEVPASLLIEEEAPLEIVEISDGLKCTIIGLEDLIIDRMNACKHWGSQIDCEMTELLIHRYINDIDWTYLENKANEPDNDILEELIELKRKASV
jgi:hypothetical protein